MTQLFSVDKKNIIISGATGVLGKAIALHLAGEGANTIILGRNVTKVDSLVNEIKERGVVPRLLHHCNLIYGN